MRVEITDIKGSQVSFRTPYGDGVGKWVGTLPTVKQTIEVEFEVKDALLWNETMWSVQSDRSSIKYENGYIEIVAESLPNGEDDCLAVKFGDSIILLELQNASGDLSGSVCFRCRSLLLYPVNV